VLSLLWRIAIVIFELIALIIAFDPFSSAPNWGMFRFFTNVSNAAALICIAAIVAIQLRHWSDAGSHFRNTSSITSPSTDLGRSDRYSPVLTSPGFPGDSALRILKHMATMGLIVTMLIAYFMLGNFTMQGTADISLTLLHKVIPLMAFLDWVFFDKKGQIARWEPVGWLAWPLAYLIIVLASASISPANGRKAFYPYPFIDVANLGVGSVIRNMALLALAFTLFGYLWFALDRALWRMAMRHAR
jgi:hypothetical protein